MKQKRICIERGCNEIAGTPWGPYWCAMHDEERRARIERELLALVADFKRMRQIADELDAQDKAGTP